jgi:negative regulator of sigma E activity
MSVDVNESISSLVDGELDTVESKKVLDKLKQEVDHRQTWGRYCLISQALKRDLPLSPKHDLFSRVQAAIASEPALLSPSPSTINEELQSAEVVELPRKAQPQAVASKKTKPLIGFAAAASFAVASVVGFQFLNSGDNQAQVGVPIASTQTVAPTQDIQVVTRTNPKVATVSTANEEPLYAEQSVINDGQWTRITHIGNMSLNGHLVGQPIESHANVSIRGNAIPFTRVITVDDSASQ